MSWPWARRKDFKQLKHEVFTHEMTVIKQGLELLHVTCRLDALEKAAAPAKRTGLCKKCRASLDDAK